MQAERSWREVGGISAKPRGQRRLLSVNPRGRFNQTMHEMHVQRLAPILEDGQAWVPAGY